MRSARDYYLELIKGSQFRAGFLAERERWLRSVEVEGREELLFELEMLLRGLKRYFNLHNLPLEKGRPVVTRDFSPELSDVRDAMDRAILLGRRLLDPGLDQKMVFRRYVESLVADDRARRALLEEELDQSTPAESLFVLRQSFQALRTIADHLLRLDLVPYALFSEVGNLVLREVVLNRYFRPFGSLEFRIEYDRIKSVALLEALRALGEPERPLFTVAFLALFRMLHYLSHVREDERRQVPPRARVVLALVRSEAYGLSLYLKGELVSGVTRKQHKVAALKAARDLARENRRVAQDVLARDRAEPRAPLEASVAFTHVLRTQVVRLAAAIDLKLEEGAPAYFALASPLEMAQRLRQDLWVFAELCHALEVALSGGEEAGREEALAAVRSFLGYFYDVSYQLLRYHDYEAFDRFAAIILELEHLPEGRASLLRLATDVRQFIQVLKATFSAINRRADLSSQPFDPAGSQPLLARFRAGR